MARYEDEPPIYLNVKSNSWLVGEGAYTAQLEMLEPGENPDDIYNIREIFVGNSPLPKIEKRVRTFSTEKLLEIGSNVLDLIKPYSLSPQSMNRGSLVGLTPTDQAFLNHFGSFPAFLEELGEEPRARRGAFDYWTLADHVQDIKEAAQEAGRKPNVRYLSDRAKASVGTDRPKPHPAIIRGRMALSELYELAGFPKIADFSRDDYKYWGVLYRMANGDAALSSGLKYLSPKGLGPSTRSVANYFGSILNFQAEVADEYEKLRSLIKPEHIKLALLEKDMAEGRVSPELLGGAKTGPQKLARYARSQVLRQLASELELSDIYRLSALDDVEDFMIGVKETKRELSPWKLQGQALRMGVYSDIWPESYIDRLKVPVVKRETGQTIGRTVVLRTINLPDGRVLKILPPAEKKRTDVGSKRAKAVVKRVNGEHKANGSKKWKSRGLRPVARTS